VVEGLPSKLEALSSIPSTENKENRERERAYKLRERRV
jgi:hypothetical protein